MDGFTYIQAETPAAVVDALARYPQAVLKAGGVDLLDLMKERIVTPAAVIDISRVAEWSGITVDPQTGTLRLGALTTLAQLAGDSQTQSHWPALSQAMASAATPQIRNMATLGGNLCQRPRCWYFRQETYPCRKKGGATCFAQVGENRDHAIFANYTCTSTHPSAAAIPLLAYDAEVEILDQTGIQRSLPLAQFFVSPERDVQREHILQSTEFLTAVTVPRPLEADGSAYLNFKHKWSFDWPMVEVAVVLHREGVEANDDAHSSKKSSSSPFAVRDARIVLGSVAPVPFRAQAAELVLEGRAVDADLARQAGQAAIRGATPLAQNEHKVTLLAELVRRTVLKAVDQLAAQDEVMPV